jgi:putative acetyltransferase
VGGFELIHAETEKHLADARELFLEYWESRQLGLYFFNFEEELASLPGEYSPPSGTLLLGYVGGKPAGCVGLRKIDVEICEMKRLYLRDPFRGRGLGRALADAIIQDARNLGYKRMRLDTVAPTMQEAVALYRRLGFVEIPPYRHNPIPGVIYMELELHGG